MKCLQECNLGYRRKQSKVMILNNRPLKVNPRYLVRNICLWINCGFTFLQIIYLCLELSIRSFKVSEYSKQHIPGWFLQTYFYRLHPESFIQVRVFWPRMFYECMRLTMVESAQDMLYLKGIESFPSGDLTDPLPLKVKHFYIPYPYV